MESDIGFQAALEEARAGFAEGGVPIGAVLVAADGKTILGRGHNMRIQNSSATLHVRLQAMMSNSSTNDVP
jgi:creatinine deaminase